jgi:hypothetical protein
LWQDSNFFQDSFFAPDNRSETPSGSEFGALGGNSSPGLELNEGPPTEPPTEPPPEGGAVVIDPPPRVSSTTRH